MARVREGGGSLLNTHILHRKFAGPFTLLGRRLEQDKCLSSGTYSRQFVLGVIPKDWKQTNITVGLRIVVGSKLSLSLSTP